jgi:transposase
MNDMVDEERNKFLVDNAIEPFANETAESLYSLIESSAMVTEEMVKEFLKNHGGAV